MAVGILQMDTVIPATRTVAVVDDDESVRAAIRSLLRSLGMHVEVFVSAEDFLCTAAIGELGCLIVDVCMPGMSGLDLQRDLVAAGHHLPTIVVSAHDDTTARKQAVGAGALAFLRKPFAETSLLDAVRSALGVEAETDF